MCPHDYHGSHVLVRGHLAESALLFCLWSWDSNSDPQAWQLVPLLTKSAHQPFLIFLRTIPFRELELRTDITKLIIKLLDYTPQRLNHTSLKLIKYFP